MIHNLKKHIGQLVNTGSRVAVVFRKLPSDDKNCLVVETERIPDSYHDYIQQILNSRESIETNDFYEVLNKRTFQDGLNCLTALHQRGYLRKELVSNVIMLPLPGQSVPLALINATIDKKVDEYVANQQSQTSAKANATAAVMQDPVSIARGLIVQAELLEQDAASKRQEAYTLDPLSRPKVGRPPTPEELKADRLAERKAKRLEKDRANAAEAKLEKKAAVLQSRIDAKIRRDEERLSK